MGVVRKQIVGAIVGSLGLLLWSGCAHRKSYEQFSPLELHKEIKKQINHDNLDDADEAFLTMEAQYPNSPYIPTDLLILAFAHYSNGEYKLAKEYLNLYEKRYSDAQTRPWCEYMKIKFDFDRYNSPYTNQKLILQIIHEGEQYLQNYPDSPYRYEVNTILAKAQLTQLYMEKEIENLYHRLGDKNISQEYNITIPKNSQPPNLPFYKKLFYW
jgi:outer membrane protein assembly factor BamD